MRANRSLLHAPKPPYTPYDPTLASVFDVLRVGAAFYDLKRWYTIHAVPDLLAFEQQHGHEHDRHKYNTKSIAEARQTLKPVLATHQGVFDWFVPVEVRGRLRGVLATGPFAKAPPTSSELLERWRSLTGRQGHLADPEFSYYVSINLSTLVLDEADVASFGRLLVCLAGVMAGDDRAEELLREAAPLRAKLELSRLVDRIWDAARTMVDQRTTRVWSSRHRAERICAPRLASPGR